MVPYGLLATAARPPSCGASPTVTASGSRWGTVARFRLAELYSPDVPGRVRRGGWSVMHLSPLQPQDLPVIQKWLSDESLFHLLAVEPLDYSKPFYLFVAREGESVIGW